MKKIIVMSLIFVSAARVHAFDESTQLAKIFAKFVESVKRYLAVDCTKSVWQAQTDPDYIGFITQNFKVPPVQCAVFKRAGAAYLDLSNNPYVTFDCNRMYDDSILTSPLYLGALDNFAPQVDQPDQCQLSLKEQ